MRERVAVERAVGVEDAGAEALDNLREDRLAGLHHGAAHLVGGENDRTMRREHLGDGGLAAAEFSGETDAQHQAREMLRRRRAALTVLDISIAMVSAPTPPGTGVYAPATAKAAGSTSPMTVDPRLSKPRRRTM